MKIKSINRLITITITTTTNLRDLIQLQRDRFKESMPNDKRWPCPFCLTKSKTNIQCIVHIKKDHPNIFSADNKLLAEFTPSNQSESNVTLNQSETNQLSDHSKSKSNVEWKKCTHCPENVPEKFYAGDRGLKIHYSKMHRDVNNVTVPSEDSHSKKEQSSSDSNNNDGMVECDFCPGKFFKIPNGIKIHKSRCKGTIANDDKSADLEDFLNLLTKYKMQTKEI